MRKNKILIIGVLLGVIAVVWFQFYVHNLEKKLTEEQIQVLKAKHLIAAGVEISENDYELIGIPKEQFASLVKVAVTDDMIPLLAGTPAKSDINPGEIILWSHLNLSLEEGIRAYIKPGQRAVAIPVDEVTSVAYLLRPGDTVDVFGTLLDPDGLEFGEVTKQILQKVHVLAVGREFRETGGAYFEGQAYATVTLSVTPEQAGKLVFVKDKLSGGMTLALRNPDDNRKVTPKPISYRNFDSVY